jgi:AcrR family transcriptional regulator
MATKTTDEGTSTRLPLTRARVVQAALRVLDAEGLAAVSMRRVGRELGVEAMSLYHHVHDKDDLLTAMCEGMLAEIDLPGDTDGDPFDQLRALSVGFRRVLLARPEAITLFSRHHGPFRTLEALVPVERTLEALRRTGLGDTDVVNAYCLLVGYTLGFVTNEEVGFLSREARAHKSEEVEGMLAALPADAFPSLVRYLPAMAERSPDESFAFGLDVILGGIRERVAGRTGRAERGTSGLRPYVEPA